MAPRLRGPRASQEPTPALGVGSPPGQSSAPPNPAVGGQAEGQEESKSCDRRGARLVDLLMAVQLFWFLLVQSSL